MTTNKQDIYLINSIKQASPEELTLMLYNGAIKFCNKAILAIKDNDINAAHQNIIRVEDIILEFRATLNFDYEISNDLDRLYEYLLRRLTEANLAKDVEILEEVNEFLRGLRDTWKEAMGIAKGKGSQADKLAL